MSSKNIPVGLNEKIETLRSLSKNRDNEALNLDEFKQKLELLIQPDQTMTQSLSVTIGGGTFAVIDVTETERSECNLFLNSINVRWMDSWKEVDQTLINLKDLSIKWALYENVRN